MSDYQQFIDFLATNLHKKKARSLKEVTNNPSSLTKYIYITEVQRNLSKYMITDKADGLRCILLVATRSQYATGKEFKRIDLQSIGIHIFDCEKIDNTFYIFDVIRYDNNDTSRQPFAQRLRHIQKFMKTWKNKPSATHKLFAKDFLPLDEKNYADQIKKLLKSPRPYEIDGIIFTRTDQPYLYTENYKWKPADKLTIDFFVTAHDGAPVLTCGISTKMFRAIGMHNINYREVHGELPSHFASKPYFPVPFMPSLAPMLFRGVAESITRSSPDIVGKIIEAKYNGTNFEMIKVRDDREVELKSGHYYGNNFQVAEKILYDCMNPLSVDFMCAPRDTIMGATYFVKSDEAYDAAKRYNNYVKRQLIGKLSNDAAKIIVDLGSGKGQDLAKYYDAKPLHLMMVEQDINAIGEMIDRKYSQRAESAPFLTIVHADINAKDTLEKIHKTGYKKECADLVCCHLALHYFTETPAHIKHLCELVANILKPGGNFLFTAFDGDVVRKSGDWASADGRYKVASGPRAEWIRVRLPCKDDEYDEHLIDMKALDAAFAGHGIKRAETQNFTHYMDQFAKEMPKIAERLDADDKKFIGHYQWAVYHKND